MTWLQARLVKEWMESGNATKSDIKAVVRIVMKGKKLARAAGRNHHHDGAAGEEWNLTFSLDRYLATRDK